MIKSQPPAINVLLVDPYESLPANTQDYLAARGFSVEATPCYEQALARTDGGTFDALVMPAPTETDPQTAEPFENLLRAIEVQGAAAIVLADHVAGWATEVSRSVDVAPTDVTKEEIQGRLSAMTHYHDMVQAMERDLNNMQRLFKQLSGRFTEVDQEMRLAGRLQNAFLPQDLPVVGPAKFAAMFRPATFVSGDIYDVYRVDETHVAFYIADAVGHGMAASLLTMFIKNAVISKVIHDDGYEVLDPGRSLQRLNQRLCEQQLPNSQFVTAAFCMLNTETLELQIARAGHPYPLHRTADGTVKELTPPGGLLGLFEDEEFPCETVQLRGGDKIILYSDGLEVSFTNSIDEASGRHYYHKALRDIAHLPGDELVKTFARQLDEEDGSLNPQDDVTLVVLDIAPAE